MVAPKMAEEIILGLVWLANWGPRIYWEKASKWMVMKRRSPNLPKREKENPKPGREARKSLKHSKAASEQGKDQQPVLRE